MPRYSERLTVPWWWWLAAPLLAGLFGAELFLGAHGALTYLPYAVLLPGVLSLLWWLGRIRIEVAGAELRVDDARLPMRFISDVVVLDPIAKRDALGPAAEPHAFVIQRPWLGRAVQVCLDDPADPTPYWLLSTRRPEELRAALRAAATAPAPRDG